MFDMRCDERVREMYVDALRRLRSAALLTLMMMLARLGSSQNKNTATGMPFITYSDINISYQPKETTRKLCCRKENARCHSCAFRFKVRRQHSLQV